VYLGEVGKRMLKEHPDREKSLRRRNSDACSKRKITDDKKGERKPKHKKTGAGLPECKEKKGGEKIGRNSRSRGTFLKSQSSSE